MGAPATWIERLGLALFGRPRPEALFMTLTAYMDESGTHKSAPTLIIGGYLASVGQWSAFEHQFRPLLDCYDVDVYHAKELKHSKGSFHGWTREKKKEFHTAMVRIIDDNLEVGFGATIRRSDYKRAYKEVVLPRRVRRDSEYGLGFRLGMYFAASWAREIGEPVHFVLESGARNAPDAIRIFDEFKAALRAEDKHLLGTITFDSKASCLPLATPDMLAHLVFGIESGPTPDGYESEEISLLGGGFSAVKEATEPGAKRLAADVATVPETAEAASRRQVQLIRLPANADNLKLIIRHHMSFGEYARLKLKSSSPGQSS